MTVVPDFRVIRPATVTSLNIQDTSVDYLYDTWDSGTTYSAGDRVRRGYPIDSVYQAVQTTTNNIPENDTTNTYWVRVSATNVFKPFDGRIDDVADAKKAVLSYRIQCTGPVDAVALLNVRAGSGLFRLIEPVGPRVNLLLWSEQPENHTLGQVTVERTVANADPSGAADARRMTEDSVTSALFRGFEVETLVSFVSGTQYTLSGYAKQAIGSRNFYLELPSGAFGANVEAVFNPSTGAVVAATNCTTAVSSAGNGWWRFSITATATATSQEFGGRVSLASGTSVNYSGNGVSTILIYGIMVNSGSVTTYQWTGGNASAYGVRTYTQSATFSSDEAYYKPAIYLRNLPALFGWHFEVYLTSINAEVGEIVMGEEVDLGMLVGNLRYRLRDYSRKDEDEFGNTTLIRRPAAQEATFNFIMDKANEGAVQVAVTDLRATPTVWSHTSDITSLATAVFGVVEEFETAAGVEEVSAATLRVKGLI